MGFSRFITDVFNVKGARCRMRSESFPWAKAIKGSNKQKSNTRILFRNLPDFTDMGYIADVKHLKIRFGRDDHFLSVNDQIIRIGDGQ